MKFSPHLFRQKSGFTLIELLVVIAVIGVLAAVILASLSDARAKARDAKRLSDIRTIHTALAAYYADNGFYPSSPWTSSFQSAWQTGVLGTALAPYLTTMPIDPVNESGVISPNGGITYSYYATGYGGTTTTQQWYMLVVRPEKSTPLMTSNKVVACSGNNFQYSGTITSGGTCAQ